MGEIWKRLRPDITNVQGVDIRAACCAAAGIHPLVLTCWGADINDLFESNSSDEGYQNRLASLIGASYYVTKDKHRALNRYKRQIAKALRHADLITAVTREILSRCEQLAGRTLPSQLFRFGVDFNLFHEGYCEQGLIWRRKLGIAEKARVLLSVRTIQPLFGHDYILDAFAQVVADRQMPETVLVFQQKYSFPQELNRLRAKMKELSLEARVFWLPDVIPPDELPFQYAMADVVINYPLQDGFPVSLLEAAACKRPIISSNLAAYENSFDDSLFLVPPANTGALAAAIKRVLLEGEVEVGNRVEQAFVIARQIGDQGNNFQSLVGMFSSVIGGTNNHGGTASTF